MKTFTDRVYDVVRKIPKGKTLTYSEVARLAGSPGAARAVGNILHKNPDPKIIPCHRVITKNGRPGSNFGLGGPSVQIEKLKKEGIKLNASS